MPEEIKNYGVILGQRPEDWLVGGGNIPFEERLPSGDWRPYLPDGERQSSRNADSMACVSFSALNVVELQTRMLTGVQENLSDRWLAKMSNTTPSGNYLWRVADTIRKAGAVPEEYWPAPKDFTWDEYYAEIPINIRGEGLKWLQKYSLAYEWLADLSWQSLAKELKQAPLQVVIPGHAVCLVLSEEDLATYFDSYKPFIKEYQSPFQSAMKIVVTLRTNNMTEAEVKALQALEGYSDQGGVAYWTGKPLSEYLKARLPDKDAELKKALEALQ